MRSIKEPNPDDEPPADEKPAAGGAVLSSAGVPRLAAVAMATLTAVAAVGATAVVARDAGGGSALVLLVFLLCAVVVGRRRVVLRAVRLIHVAVVRVRAVDRNRDVDVGLLRACLARSRLFCAVFIASGLGLLDLLTAAATFARERCARGHGERTDAHRHG